MTLVDVFAAMVGAVGVAFVIGVGCGLFLGRELRIYREANRRGGDLDLTGRRP